MRGSLNGLRRNAVVVGLWLLASVGLADAPLEEVLVTGEQPGPGLWKVTRPGDADGHALWILGDYSPLPKKMEWRSSELDSVLEASQELIGPAEVDAKVGPLGGITLLPSLVGVRRNPDGGRLQDVVPPELYARWLPLKSRYLGDDDDVEEWRPIFAAQELYHAALEQHDLVPYAGVWRTVERRARKFKVPVTRPEIELKVDNPRGAIREFKTMPLSDVECFARTLQRLEADLGLMRDRANAWAVGDIAALRRLAPVQRASACIGVVLDSPLVRERGLGHVLDRARNAWLETVERAFARNVNTVAVVSIEELLRADGHLARLRSRGYVVDDP
jgi:hypothetical protein